jgi:hypothetical protein
MTNPAPDYRHWEVQPRSIRVSAGEFEQRIPLSLRGDVEDPVFTSRNPEVAAIGADGVVRCGRTVGNAVLMVWRSSARESLRHVRVEVRDPSWFAELPDFTSRARVFLNGMVINARNTNGVGNALIEFRRSEAGPAAFQTFSNADGRFELTVPEDSYYVEVTAPGYIAWHNWVNADPSASGDIQIALSPELQGQVARIVLQWDLNPRDLDSHLTGPTPSGDRFHVYYGHRIENNVAELDIDDTSSYGPETITIHRLIPGVYRYAVHDYTNRNAKPSTGLAQSGATVKVFLNSGHEQTFNVPNAPGTVWTVFEIDGATGALMPVNAMSYSGDGYGDGY